LLLQCPQVPTYDGMAGAERFSGPADAAKSTYCLEGAESSVRKWMYLQF
jgi:hypothetical protein